MVAKSYQNLATFGEPFAENGKKYIIVITNRGAHKKVRWYTDAEYAKMYPDEKPTRIRSVKEVLGFSKGYITIYKGDTYSVLDWFRERPECRYHEFWGWYTVSEEVVPVPPAGIEPVQLRWEDIAFVDEDALKSESAIKDHLATLLYEPSPSRWQGEVGDRIDRKLTVIKVTPIDGYYGPTSFHLFSDEAGNEYCWTTASKILELGKTYQVRGTIKQLSKYKGKEQTILTRCRV